MAGLGARDRALGTLDGGQLDVLVVGGINGAGVLLEAVLRGYRAGLVEAVDFASGASGRSTKLVHGGLRYLARGELAIVREAARERDRLLRLAPDLVTPLPYLLPLDSRLERERGRLVLALYDHLGLGALPRHRFVTQGDLATRFRAYAHLGPHGAWEYFEAQTEDARLTIAVLRAAVERGAVVANHVVWTGQRPDDGGNVVELRDALGGGRFEVRASCLVLAVGAALGMAASRSGWKGIDIRPGKGVHLVLRTTAFPASHALAVREPQDRRYLTLRPWRGHLLVGSTDTPADDSELRSGRVQRHEIEYLLAGTRRALPDADLALRAAWSGFRPLIGGGTSTVSLSREDRIFTPGDGVLAVCGGKLTTFRPIARRALDLIDARSGRRGAEGVPGAHRSAHRARVRGDAGTRSRLSRRTPTPGSDRGDVRDPLGRSHVPARSQPHCARRGSRERETLGADHGFVAQLVSGRGGA